jgi:hypothetical protein
MKKRHSLMAVLAAAALASFNVTAPLSEAASKNDKSSAQKNPKRRDSSNAQWRADPERGWVRDEERDEPDHEHKQKVKQHRKGNNQSRSY